MNEIEVKQEIRIIATKYQRLNEDDCGLDSI